MGKLSDNKLFSLRNNVVSNDDYWYITKQECNFRNLCYIGEILSRWDADGPENYQDFFNRIKVTPEFEQYVGSTAHRATINLTPYGLRLDEKSYNPSDLTDVFFKIKEITKGDYSQTSLYQNIIDAQIEKINVVTPHISISPMMFTFKVLLTLGDVTGEYSVSKEEFKTFISTAAKWSEFFEVADSILRFRSDSQYRNDVSTSEGKKIAYDTRYNLVIDNHSMIKVEGNKISITGEVIDQVRMKVARYEMHKPVDIDDTPLSAQLTDIDQNDVSEQTEESKRYLRAMRTKPFLLLAGISGTGKSRIVRQLAKACWPVGSDEATAHKPSNFEMIQVKPNWHDSSELIGYVSRIGDKPRFIAGNFLKFIAKAWENPSVPYFLCLDEMNLAPVEQYFAEYLSVIESRKLQEDGKTIITDPIIKQESGNSEDGEWYQNLCNSLTQNETLQHQFLGDGIRIPQNLIVVGTVNMDETTYSFSRKVLDRAMTIEMNEVKLDGGLTKADLVMPHIPAKAMLATAVEGCDVYVGNEDVADIVINYLGEINTILANTPFRIAYRTRNEFLIYVVNAIRLAGNDTDRNQVIADALDEVTSMKILSRIEGDKRKVHFLDKLRDTIKIGLDSIDKGDRSEEHSVSLAKIDTMSERLKSGYTSFWD